MDVRQDDHGPRRYICCVTGRGGDFTSTSTEHSRVALTLCFVRDNINAKSFLFETGASMESWTSRSSPSKLTDRPIGRVPYMLLSGGPSVRHAVGI